MTGALSFVSSLAFVPPAGLVAFALGSILFGWATPTEGAGCGAFGALFDLARRQMTLGRFGEALIKTLEITVLILPVALNFGGCFSCLGTPTMLNGAASAVDSSQMQVLLIIMAPHFLLGWPLGVKAPFYHCSRISSSSCSSSLISTSPGSAFWLPSTFRQHASRPLPFSPRTF